MVPSVNLLASSETCLVARLQLNFVLYFQKGRIFGTHLRIVMACHISVQKCHGLFFFIYFCSDASKKGYVWEKQVLQPMLEKLSAALGFLYVRQGLAIGIAGNLCIKNLLSDVLPSWKVSE